MSLNLEMKVSKVFAINQKYFEDKKIRTIVNQGGTRSSKTYSICQLLILEALQKKNLVISIVRATFPALRGSAMRDFFEILNNMGIYTQKNHNKTEHIYLFPESGSMVEFFSVDDEQKIRGRKRDILYINEANELMNSEFTQLNFRTTKKIIIDFNPSETTSWVYDVALKENSKLIISTYKDNPFLEKDIINYIEGLKDEDEELYRIFALGLRAASKKNVYSHFKFIPEKSEKFKDFVYGLDFGFNHPTALLKIWFNEKEIFVEEVIFESRLTTTDLIQRMSKLGIDKNKEILADYSRPEIISEIRQAGYFIKNADKKVKQGIDLVKTYKINVSEKARNVRKEFENYKWKTNGDVVLDDPLKLYDDAMDAIRYAVMHINESNKGPGFWIY